MLSFAGCVMIAASFWSLLVPAIEMPEELSIPSWIPAVGFFSGGSVLRLIDTALPHLHRGFSVDQAEGIKTSRRRTTGIGLQNFPEGLAVSMSLMRKECLD